MTRSVSLVLIFQTGLHNGLWFCQLQNQQQSSKKASYMVGIHTFRLSQRGKHAELLLSAEQSEQVGM